MEKVKNFFHHSDSTEHSAHAEGFKDSEIRSKVHATINDHSLTESKADEEIKEREITEEESSSLPISSASNLNSAATHDSNLSSYEPRQSLAEAASHEGGNGHEHPDLTSFRHIPEAELVQRTERSEHTATRPNDLNDPKSMDGAGEPSTAGDDLAI